MSRPVPAFVSLDGHDELLFRWILSFHPIYKKRLSRHPNELVSIGDEETQRREFIMKTSCEYSIAVN